MSEGSALELYATILRTIGEHASEIEPRHLASHWPHVGTRYRRGGLLIAGQALQGWDSAVTGARWDPRQAGSESDRKEILDRTRSWFAAAPEPIGVIAELGNRSRSPFWTLCRDVVEHLAPGDGVWYSRFAWANVFPVSFDQPGDSPAGALKDAQEPLAGRLFGELVDMLDPSMIVVIAGPNFWRRTTQIAGTYEGLQSRPFPMIEAGQLSGRTWVIGYHPTYARRRGLTAAQYAGAIVDAVVSMGEPDERALVEPAVETTLPFARYPHAGRVLLGKPPAGDGTARHGYAADVLRFCDFRCAYCGLDMRSFDGWLQLSVDHVVPQQMIAVGFPSEWVLDTINVVACCRACNELFNRDPAAGDVPATLESFLALRDRLFTQRRERILARRRLERVWFDEHVITNGVSQSGTD